MLADGGGAIADLAVLRHQGEVFGPVASTPTAWRLLADIDGAALASLRAARASAREVAWMQAGETGEGIPAARAGGRELPGLVLDLDATLVACHFEKEQAAPDHGRVRLPRSRRAGNQELAKPDIGSVEHILTMVRSIGVPGIQPYAEELLDRTVSESFGTLPEDYLAVMKEFPGGVIAGARVFPVARSGADGGAIQAGPALHWPSEDRLFLRWAPSGAHKWRGAARGTSSLRRPG